MGVRSAMSAGTDWDELAVVWKGWRDQAAKPNRQNYAEFVAARNRAAVSSGEMVPFMANRSLCQMTYILGEIVEDGHY